MNIDQQKNQKKEINSIKEAQDFILSLSSDQKINAVVVNQSYKLLEKLNQIPLCILLGGYDSEEKSYGIEIYYPPKKNGRMFLDYGCEIDVKGDIYYNVAVQSVAKEATGVSNKIGNFIAQFEKKADQV